MLKYKHICDKCKKEVEENSAGIPDEWTQLAFKVRSYSFIDDYVTKSLCKQCSKALGIVLDERKSEETNMRSIGDRLVDILSEIAQGAQE